MKPQEAVQATTRAIENKYSDVLEKIFKEIGNAANEGKISIEVHIDLQSEDAERIEWYLEKIGYNAMFYDYCYPKIKVSWR